MSNNSTLSKFDLGDPCPKCKSEDSGFECIQMDLDEEFGLKITCNKCGAVFHEIYKFAFWEEIKN